MITGLPHPVSEEHQLLTHNPKASLFSRVNPSVRTSPLFRFFSRTLFRAFLLVLFRDANTKQMVEVLEPRRGFGVGVQGWVRTCVTIVFRLKE